MRIRCAVPAQMRTTVSVILRERTKTARRRIWCAYLRTDCEYRRRIGCAYLPTYALTVSTVWCAAVLRNCCATVPSAFLRTLLLSVKIDTTSLSLL